MSIRHTLPIAALAAGLGGTILPTLAQNSGGMGAMPGQGMGQMTESGRAGHGAMSGRMMPQGTMSRGCSGMMQSMNGSGGRPNSQWQATPKGGDAPD